MSDFFARISHPALTDVSIDWGSMAVSDVYPAKLPDMFVGRAVVVTGKYHGTASAVSVAGMQGLELQRLPVALSQNDAAKASISRIWARLRIAELADRQTWERDPQGELADAIKRTALEHQLVSDYTSFVAVDASRITEGGYGVTVPQAVPVPDGVSYQTTIKEN